MNRSRIVSALPIECAMECKNSELCYGFNYYPYSFTDPKTNETEQLGCDLIKALCFKSTMQKHRIAEYYAKKGK